MFTRLGSLFPFTSRSNARTQGPASMFSNALLMNRIGNVFLKEFRELSNPEFLVTRPCARPIRCPHSSMVEDAIDDQWVPHQGCRHRERAAAPRH